MTARRRLAAVLSLSALTLGISSCAEETPSADPTPAGETTAQDPVATETASEKPETPASTEPAGAALPVYFAGDGPDGPRLFREFVKGTGGDALSEAATIVDGGTANDPDYRTLWPGNTIASVEASDGLLVVRLEGDAFTEAPDGMPRKEARLAIQQLVYTLQGVQQERVPLQFVRDSGPARLFGLDVSKPVKQASALKVLNHVNITSPEHGATVPQGALEVAGVANSFEANVICGIDAAGAGTPFTAEGWMGDKLFPFSGELDLSAAGPGEVTLTCSTDDASGGAEGPGAFTDTKVLTVG